MNLLTKTFHGKTVTNTAMLYLLTFAKLIFPFITLPYLTRVLSTDCYGVVSYVKSCMSYMQLIVDFGFIMTAVKDIVKAEGDNRRIGVITGDVLVAKTLLALGAVAATAVMTVAIPLLRAYPLFTLLSVFAVVINGYFADFLFRGIEKMHVITIVFVVAKGIATSLTFVLVRGDADILWIPLLDIIGNAVSVIVSLFFVRFYRIRIRFSGFRETFFMMRESSVCFISNFATTAFAALNTVMLGIIETDTSQIAYWSVALQLIAAVQNLYSPIDNGIYPQMVRERSLKLIRNILLIFMPVVFAGCAFCYFLSDWIITFISGAEYVAATPVFRWLLLVLIFSFPGMLIGWPTLGAIGKEKQVTLTTILTAVLQILGLALLALFRQFTITNLAILRGGTELVLLLSRAWFVFRYRNEFSDSMLLFSRKSATHPILDKKDIKGE